MWIHAKDFMGNLIQLLRGNSKKTEVLFALLIIVDIFIFNYYYGSGSNIFTFILCVFAVLFLDGELKSEMKMKWE